MPKCAEVRFRGKEMRVAYQPGFSALASGPTPHRHQHRDATQRINAGPRRVPPSRQSLRIGL